MIVYVCEFSNLDIDEEDYKFKDNLGFKALFHKEKKGDLLLHMTQILWCLYYGHLIYSHTSLLIAISPGFGGVGSKQNHQIIATNIMYLFGINKNYIVRAMLQQKSWSHYLVKEGWGIADLVEYLSNMHEAPGSIPSTICNEANLYLGSVHP